MLIGIYEHLTDGEVLITDPAADTTKGNGVNNRVFGLPPYQLVQVKFWLPAGVYEIFRECDGCVRIVKRGAKDEVTLTHQGRVSSAFTRWISIVDIGEYYSGKYFDEVEHECISFDPDSFLRSCKKRRMAISPSFEFFLRKHADMRTCPFVSDLLGERQIDCSRNIPNNSWYMYIMSLLESSDDGCVSFPGFVALSTCGEFFDIQGIYDVEGPCGLIVKRVEGA